MTALAPDPSPPQQPPRFVRWGACERCGAAGLASEADDRFCQQCLPPEPEQRRRAALVGRRVQLARYAADRARRAATDAPVAPDAEHVWLQPRGRGVAHLFANATETSRCGRSWLARPARADLDTPAPENGAACRSCWTAYRSGRR